MSGVSRGGLQGVLAEVDDLSRKAGTTLCRTAR